MTDTARQQTRSSRFEWVLWPGDEISRVADEFVCGRFRVRLMGQRLVIEAVLPLAEAQHQATELAERYTAALRRHTPTMLRLLSDKDFASLPPQFITVPTPFRVADLSRGIRGARSEILGEANARLRRCYDYLQAAVEDEKHMLSNLYKLVETVEDQFGGESQASRSLKVGAVVKLVKRLANEGKYDERHPPESPGRVGRIGEKERNAALEGARKVLWACEDYLLSSYQSHDS